MKDEGANAATTSSSSCLAFAALIINLRVCESLEYEIRAGCKVASYNLSHGVMDGKLIRGFKQMLVRYYFKIQTCKMFLLRKINTLEGNAQILRRCRQKINVASHDSLE